MILPRQLLEHDTLTLAVLLIARKLADSGGLSLDEPLAVQCRRIGANRTSVYEQAQRVLDALEALASARPGRPPASELEPASSDEIAGLRLTIDVLEYCLDHPGAMLRSNGRTQYSPGLRRFILARFDRWEGSLEQFADAVEIPLDTLRDWLQYDRDATPEPEPKPPPAVPRDASQVTREIAELWHKWVGSPRQFIGHAARTFGIPASAVQRVLQLLGLVSRRRRKPPRYRGTSQPLSPGAMLVTDGKTLDIALTGSGRRTHRNWQGIVDQATGCDTAVVVTDEECASGARRAYDASVTFLGSVKPEALLHDNKPCYDDASLRQHIEQRGTSMIPATLGRAENKAVIEGSFSLFEQRVGTIVLDDTNRRTLVDTAVSEIVRAYTAATNAVPRSELNGKSREQALHEACPSREQQRRDQLFLRQLRARHDRSRTRSRNLDAVSVTLLDEVFRRLGILDKDPKGSLRRYLASFEPTAIRRAAAIVTAKLDRGALEPEFLHRYLAAVIRNQQDELDLERAAQELLELCRIQNQTWTANEERDFQALLSSHRDPAELLRTVAEHAAFGGIPVQAAYWTNKLLDLLRSSLHLAADIKTHLRRLYEAPWQRRLQLIDSIVAMECALA